MLLWYTCILIQPLPSSLGLIGNCGIIYWHLVALEQDVHTCGTRSITEVLAQSLFLPTVNNAILNH